MLVKEEITIKEEEITITDSVKIKLPSKFNLVDFLDTSFKVEVKKHIKKHQKNNDKDYLNHFMGKDIVKIYTSLKEVK